MENTLYTINDIIEKLNMSERTAYNFMRDYIPAKAKTKLNTDRRNKTGIDPEAFELACNYYNRRHHKNINNDQDLIQFDNQTVDFDDFCDRFWLFAKNDNLPHRFGLMFNNYKQFIRLTFDITGNHTDLVLVAEFDPIKNEYNNTNIGPFDTMNMQDMHDMNKALSIFIQTIESYCD